MIQFVCSGVNLDHLFLQAVNSDLIFENQPIEAEVEVQFDQNCFGIIEYACQTELKSAILTDCFYLDKRS